MKIRNKLKNLICQNFWDIKPSVALELINVLCNKLEIIAINSLRFLGEKHHYSYKVEFHNDPSFFNLNFTVAFSHKPNHWKLKQKCPSLREKEPITSFNSKNFSTKHKFLIYFVIINITPTANLNVNKNFDFRVMSFYKLLSCSQIMSLRDNNNSVLVENLFSNFFLSPSI